MVRAILVFACVSAAAVWGLDEAALQAKVKELDSPDLKVRAAAAAVLIPQIKDIAEAAKKNKDLIPVLQKVEIALEKQIAHNETKAGAACLAYSDAQLTYHQKDYDKDGKLEYAQSIAGDNSLCESKKGLGDLLLLDREFLAAEWGQEKPVPRSGYFFKVLKRQGANARGEIRETDGVRDYMMNGNMMRGYALLAFPAEHGVTGRKCFSINQANFVFGRDYGAGTREAAEKMEAYDPGEGWEQVE